jgi:hypothetical protein
MALKASAVLDHPGIGKALGVALPTFGGKQDVGALLVARRPGMDTLPILESLGFDAKEVLDMLKAQAIATGENPVVETTMRPGYWNHPDGVLSLACKDSVRATLVSISKLLANGVPVASDNTGRKGGKLLRSDEEQPFQVRRP